VWVVSVKGVQASRNDGAVELGDRHRRPTQSHHLFSPHRGLTWPPRSDSPP
jgi:hypothetical protein